MALAKSGAKGVIAADLRDSMPGLGCHYEKLDVTDRDRYTDMVKSNNITYIVHLAAILSSLGEQKPELCYSVNVDGAKIALDLARDHNC